MARLIAVAVIMLLSGINQFNCEASRSSGKGSKWWGVAQMSEDSRGPAELPSGGHLVSNSLRSNRLRSGRGGRGRYSNPIFPLDPYNKLHKKQRRLVRDNQGVLQAVAMATRLAVLQCKHQFRNSQWNCPTQELANGRRLFGKIVNKACRETSFVYAMTSAAVTHAVARGCSEGTIQSCSCQQGGRIPAAGPDWQWGGCSDNINFGYQFSRRFVDAGEQGSDLRYLVNLHNNEAGRKAVSDSMERECKCHGMSGSCTVKTCWKRLPTLEKVGDMLKEGFDSASRVRSSNEVPSNRRKLRRKQRYVFNLQPFARHHKPPSREDLVYYEKSPNFCEKNLRMGLPGTVGRLCNDTSTGLDGCDLMCCGRGFHTQVREVRERCQCKFKWCCDVECKVCRTRKVEHRCL